MGARRERASAVPLVVVALVAAALALPTGARATQDQARRIRVAPIPTVGVEAAAPTRVGMLTAAHEGDPTAAFVVSYTGFTPEAQTAFQAAVDVWSRTVASGVPIAVDAGFRSFGPGEAGFIGFAEPVLAFGDAIGHPDDPYPTALLNSLAHVDVLPDDPDIEVDFNSDSPFYYGTDGLPPPGTFDFMSLVLHELNHGLAFAGFRSVDGPNGTVGLFDAERNTYIGLPWDHTTVNGNGQPLLNGPIPNNSPQMKAVLTGDRLFWGGAAGAAASPGGVRPKLYAPPAFSPGSSYVHLDESTYPPGDANSLMTPNFSFEEVIHAPGPIALGMMVDEGWQLATSDRRAPSVTELTASSATSAPGEAVTFTADVQGAGDTPTGTVQFAIDGVARGEPVVLADGAAPLVVDDLASGPHAITASYSGDDVYRPSEASLRHRVHEPPPPPPPEQELSPLCRLLKPVLELTLVLTCQ